MEPELVRGHASRRADRRELHLFCVGNFEGAMARIAECKLAFEDNADLITQIYTVADIRRAQESGRVGIMLGWQNTSGIEDQISFLRLFHELGVRVMQLTYNTTNLCGTGCYEAGTEVFRTLVARSSTRRSAQDLDRPESCRSYHGGRRDPPIPSAGLLFACRSEGAERSPSLQD
jgi:hypothetical protein